MSWHSTRILGKSLSVAIRTKQLQDIVISPISRQEILYDIFKIMSIRKGVENVLVGLAIFVTFIIDITFIGSIFSSAFNAIRYKENFITLVKEKYLNMFEYIKFNLKLVYLFFIIAVIVFLNSYLIIVKSGANAQIGSFFEANSFAAKYQATVEVVNNGNFPYYNTFIKSIDGATVEALVEKNITESNTYYTQTFYGEDVAHTNYDSKYYISLVEYGDYSLILDVDNLTEVKINNPTKFEPKYIYKNGKEYNPYYGEDYSDDMPPTFKITLSDKLIEKISDNQYKSIVDKLIMYIIFLFICIIYVTWFFVKKSDNEIQEVERSIEANNKLYKFYKQKASTNSYWVMETEETLKILHERADELYEQKSLEKGMTVNQYREYLKQKSKKASVLSFIIALIISVLLIVLPLYYIVSNDASNRAVVETLNKTTLTTTTTTQATTISTKTTTATTQDSDYEERSRHIKEVNDERLEEYKSYQKSAEEKLNQYKARKSSDVKYLLNPESMKIHNEDCYTIKHKENFIETIDYYEAIDDGYTPCKVCNP